MERWLEKAEHDLKAAQILNEAQHFTDTICFHIHQSIEKYLTRHSVLDCFEEME